MRPVRTAHIYLKDGKIYALKVQPGRILHPVHTLLSFTNSQWSDQPLQCNTPHQDTSPLRTSTHNLKPPSPVLTRVTTIVRVNQNKRPTDQNKKSGDPNPSKQSWGTIPNSEYSFDRGEKPFTATQE
ncbi:hypothetical protein ABEB36_009629 [Hypothenemus hampei]|uniref:Uncharacterized protein n=1 Tax=Hypothenemus hampei TaxID=57062 RepID=A0ABD1EGY1_HYPHA